MRTASRQFLVLCGSAPDNARVRLEARSLAQSPGNDARARLLFENVGLSWESPALHVVMGPSGGGKSSLLKTLGGVWMPRRGEVLLDGKPPTGDTLRRVGFAFQNNALFGSLRVLENLLFPHRQRFPDMDHREREALAREWLAKVGLEATAAQHPHELSGGMQKRLSLARALILKPDFVFLDDPTAGLDPITSRTMSELVSSLLKGSESLVVIVTNDTDRARDWGPNLHFLAEGGLHSPGSPDYERVRERCQ